MSKRIAKHPLLRTPNVGGILTAPTLIVCHYTASTSLRSTVEWLCNPKARASAHVVVGRGGEIEALVPYDRIAWHAGVSSWRDRPGCNSFSIGIELMNAGPLRKDADGQYRTLTGGQVVPADEVFTGKHKNGKAQYSYWQSYSEPQIAALDNLVGQLFHDFPSVRNVVGHDDVAPERKTDPGPAFEKHMRELQAKYDKPDLR